MPLPAFDAVAGKFASSQNAPKSSLEMFTLLCEEIVDRVADILEQLAGELAAERRMVVVRRYSDCSLGRGDDLRNGDSQRGANRIQR